MTFLLQIALQFLKNFKREKGLLLTADKELMSLLHVFLASHTRYLENIVSSTDVRLYEYLKTFYLGVLGTIIPVAIFSMIYFIVVVHRRVRTILSFQLRTLDYVFRAVIMTCFAFAVMSLALLLLRSVHIQNTHPVNKDCSMILRPLRGTTIAQLILVAIQLLVL